MCLWRPPVASVYLCASLRCRMCFVGITFVFGQLPVMLGSLIFIFSSALRFLLIVLFSAGAWGCAVSWGSIRVFLLIVLFYSFSGFESLLIPFSFFFVFFIRLSFRCFHLRCLGLPQWFAWTLLDRPDFQITVHSHCFESSMNHWPLQKDLHAMEEFCFFRFCQDRVRGLVPSASSGYDPFSFCSRLCYLWNPMGSQFGGDTFPYWQSYYSWC